MEWEETGQSGRRRVKTGMRLKKLRCYLFNLAVETKSSYVPYEATWPL